MITLRLDKNGGINKGDVQAFEHDNLSEVYIIQLYKNGAIYDLTNKSIELTMVERKRKIGDMVTLPIYNATEGKIKLEVVSDITKQDGIYDFKLTVKDTTGLIETFPSFQVKIENDITDHITGEIVQDKNFTILTEGLKALADYNIYKTNALKVPEIEQDIVEINEQLDNNTKYNNTINLGKLGIVSENVSYNQSTKTYNMTDISNVINNVINSGCDTLIFPSGNFLIENTITIDRALTLIGNGCNIYSSPSVKTKTIFKVTNSNVSISGFNFYSEQEYENNVDEATANSITSNITAISILGKDEYQKNVNVSNCYFDKMGFGISVMFTKYVTLYNLKAVECYFPIYTGYNAENIVIRDCDLSAQLETDVYGHVLYFADTSKNICVDNCKLASLGKESSNIVKCGSNTGNSSNVVVNNCDIECCAKTSLFYVHTNGDLVLNNCNIKSYSPNGYARVLQLGDNCYFKCYGCKIELDSFDKFTQRLNILNSSLLFENCNITIKNSYETYCTLGFISGVDDFIFKNCDISFNLDRGLNIMNGDFRSVSLINCNINTTKNIICGQYDSNHINYSQTSSPVLKIYNTIIKNNNVDDMGASCFFMNIVKDGTTTPICELSNVTLYKCSGTSGGNNGKLFMPNAETQYIKNNVIDLQP